MPKTKDQVTVDFDHHRPVTEVDPEEAYANLRQTCPVSWTDAHGGYWVVTKFTDVDRVTKDFRVFSSKDGLAIPPHGFGQNVPVDLDPPEHTQYRRALNPLLSKEAVEAMQPRVSYWTDHLIDSVIARGECDLIYDIAIAVPAAVTLEWVGWEERSEWQRIGEAWHDLISRPLVDAKATRARADIGWFDQRIAEELEARRREPRDDIISYIAQLEIDGEPIAPDRAVGLVRICVAGGVDTVTSLIGAALVHLHFHPADRDRLLADPDLWITGTEEFLRRYPPVRMVARTVMEEVEVGGCLFEPGDRVLVALGSAGVDDEQTEGAADFILDRRPNKHAAFGSGVHRCVGLHLAREEFRTVVRRVLERLPDYQVIEERLVPYARQSEVAGWLSAPAVFTPGSPLANGSTDAHGTAP